MSTSDLPLNSLHLSLPIQIPQYCSQCKLLLPSSSFPIKIETLQLFPICNSHTWYWSQSSRHLTLAPELISTIDELGNGIGILVRNRENAGEEEIENGVEGRWICEGLVESKGLERIMLGGTLDSEELKVPRKRTIKKDQGPPETLYLLSPALSRLGPNYHLKVYLHHTVSKTVFTLRELDLKGKPVKIQVVKPAKKLRGKAKRGIWLNPDDDGEVVSGLEGSIGDGGEDSIRLNKKLKLNPGKGKNTIKRLVEVGPPPIPILPNNIPSLLFPPPTPSTSKRIFVDQLDMLASVLDEATKDTDIMIPRKKRAILSSNLPSLPLSYSNSSTISDNNGINSIRPKRRIALTHHPLAKSSSTSNSIFHPVAITTPASSSPTRNSPVRRAASGLVNNSNHNASGIFISPTRISTSTINNLSIPNHLSTNYNQPLSLADLLASPFLGSPPLPIRKKQPLTFLSALPPPGTKSTSTSTTNFQPPFQPHPSTLNYDHLSPSKRHLPHSPSRLGINSQIESTTPQTSPARNTRSRFIQSTSTNSINPELLMMEDILNSSSDEELSQDEVDEEEDEEDGDWLTGFVKGQLGSRYLDKEEEGGDGDDDEGQEGSGSGSESESESGSEDSEDESEEEEEEEEEEEIGGVGLL